MIRLNKRSMTNEDVHKEIGKEDNCFMHETDVW